MNLKIPEEYDYDNWEMPLIPNIIPGYRGNPARTAAQTTLEEMWKNNYKKLVKAAKNTQKRDSEGLFHDGKPIIHFNGTSISDIVEKT